MNVVCIGAHPDDPEFWAGGMLLRWAREGHRVVAVSMTQGDLGHHVHSGDALAALRTAEAAEAARRGGYLSEVLPFHDGYLTPSPEVREAVVRLIRRYEADIVLTHRPCDYHPDHRYAAMAVQDAAYMVMVPHYCPDVPALRHNPCFFYMMDRFTKPTPFQPDVLIDIEGEMAQKLDLLDAMPSQVYEWLPWIEGVENLPEDIESRRALLEQFYRPFFEGFRGYLDKAISQRYGESAKALRYIEAFEICEYGAKPGPEDLQRLFPGALTPSERSSS